MRTLIFAFVLALPISAICQLQFHPPVTEKKPVTDTLHGYFLTVHKTDKLTSLFFFPSSYFLQAWFLVKH